MPIEKPLGMDWHSASRALHKLTRGGIPLAQVLGCIKWVSAGNLLAQAPTVINGDEGWVPVVYTHTHTLLDI